MNRIRQRRNRKKVNLGFEKLEPKRCLASFGWDGAGQGSAELTYYLGDAPEHVGQQTFESVIEQALDVWSDIVDISFSETSSPRQLDSLDITFASLDGSGGVLAQAYFPDDVNRSRIAGDVQFDASENWEVGNQQGSGAFDLLYVAVHEIGHALGLEHSDTVGSVLYHSVSPNQQFTSLADGDRNSALALYAPAIAATPLDPVDTPSVEEPTIPTDADNPLEDPAEDPVDEPTEPTAEDPATDDPAEPDTQHRQRWRNFRRGGFNRFRFFSFFEHSFESDTTETIPTDEFSQRFQFRIFRYFR